MDASVKTTIAQALFDFSGSGQGVDDMLEAIAHSQAESVMSALRAHGYRIIHDSENHGPTVERAAAWHDHNAEMLENGDSPYSAWHKGAAAAIRAMEKKDG